MKRNFIKGVLGATLAGALAISLASCTKSYMISFEENEGTDVTDIEFDKNGKIEKLPVPSKEGFVFGGWYKDIDLLEKFSLNDPLPEGSFTLYAKWDVELKFDSLGGSEVKSVIGEPKQVFVKPGAPTKVGSIFKGWYYDKEFKNALGPILPAKNTTVYAKWETAEDTTALQLDSFTVNANDATGILQDGNKYTATASKGEWAHIYTTINANVKSYGAIRLDVKGTKGTEIMLKVEGGAAAVKEERFILSGEDETIFLALKEEELTATGGQKVLIFIAPGVLGSEKDVQDSIEVKQVSVVKTGNPSDINKESAIFFESNGGSKIDTQFGLIGSNLTLPENPTKPFSEFKGWFTDKDLTKPFTGTKYPESAIILYAKWEATSNTLNLLDKKFIENDKDTYTFNKTESGLEISKIDKSTWKFAHSELTGKDIQGFGYLKIELTGTKGKRALFKVNDNNLGEKWVDLTGESQYVVIDFTKIQIDDNKPALLLALNPEEDAVASINITKFEFSNVLETKSFMDADSLKALDQNSYNINAEAGKLSIEKTTENQYSFLKSTLTVSDIKGAKMLIAKVKGVKGEEILFKFFDKVELRVVLTGDVQTVEFTLPEITEDMLGNGALLLVINSGKAGASQGVEFTQLDYVF